MMLTETEIKEFLENYGYRRKKYAYDTNEDIPKKLIMVAVVDDQDTTKELVKNIFEEKDGKL